MTKPAFSPTKIGAIRALKNTVLVKDMEFAGRQLSSGIVLLNDNGTTAGIRPRWGQVYAVGPEQKDVSVGQWICVAHGRWTRGIEVDDDVNAFTIRKVDPKDILLVTNEQPSDDTMSTAIQASKKER